jgi:hypothetical protein
MQKGMQIQDSPQIQATEIKINTILEFAVIRWKKTDSYDSDESTAMRNSEKEFLGITTWYYEPFCE